MQLNVLMATWPELAGGAFHSLGFGRSHWTRLVETAGASYVLRVYQADQSVECIGYELALLEQLHVYPLPFAIPSPLPDRHGQLLARLPDETGRSRYAVLWQHIPGRNPTEASTTQIFSAGQALAQLRVGLETLSPASLAGLPPLNHQRELLPYPDEVDPIAWLMDLPLASQKKAVIAQLVQEMRALTPGWYRTLPQQIIHGDYLSGNVLMQDSRVSGVVDFELAGPDLRVLDLVIALCRWPEGRWGQGSEWTIVEQLGRGYTSYLPLSPAEIEALPLLFQLHWAVLAMIFIRRYQAGQAPLEVLDMFVTGAVKIKEWTGEHGTELISRARQWEA